MTRNERHTAGKRYASIFEFAEAAENGEEWEEEEYSLTRAELLKSKAHPEDAWKARNE